MSHFLCRKHMLPCDIYGAGCVLCHQASNEPSAGQADQQVSECVPPDQGLNEGLHPVPAAGYVHVEPLPPQPNTVLTTAGSSDAQTWHLVGQTTCPTCGAPSSRAVFTEERTRGTMPWVQELQRRLATERAAREAAEDKVLRVVRGRFEQICSYCGWETPASGGTWDDLQAHIKVCEKHPLRQAEQQRDAALAGAAQNEKDAAIGRWVRVKLTSGNAIPVERCTIRADEVDALAKETK